MIVLAAPSVHSTWWSQIVAQNRDLCLPHFNPTFPLRGSPLEYSHDVWYGKTKMVWLPQTNERTDVMQCSVWRPMGGGCAMKPKRWADVTMSHMIPTQVRTRHLMLPSILVVYRLVPSNSRRYRHSYRCLIRERRPVTIYCYLWMSVSAY